MSYRKYQIVVLVIVLISGCLLLRAISSQASEAALSTDDRIATEPSFTEHNMGVQSLEDNSLAAGSSTYSVAGENAKLHYQPFVNTSATWLWETETAIQNTTVTDTELSLHYYDGDGVLVTTEVYTLPAHASQTYLASDAVGDGFSGSLVITSAQNIAAIAHGTPIPYWAGEGLVSYATPTISTTEMILAPIYRNPGGWNSTFSLQNTADVPTALTVTFHNITGTLIYSHTDTLPSRGSANYATPSWDALGEDFQGIAIVQADSPLVGVTLAVDPAAGVMAHNSIPISESSGGGTGLEDYCLHLPFVNKNYPGSSLIWLHNRGESPANVMINFYDSEGNVVCSWNVAEQIPVNGQQMLSLLDLWEIPDGYLGSAIVASDSPVDAWVNASTTAGNDERIGYEATAAGSETVAVPFVRGIAPNAPTTRIFVQNIGADDAAVSLSYYDENGALTNTVSDFIPPGAMQTFEPSEVRGSAIVTGVQPLAVVGYVERDPLASTHQSTLDDLQKGDLCTSTYTLHNAGSQMATLQHTFYDQFHRYEHTFGDSLSVDQSRTYDLDEINELPTGYTGYGVVNADQPFTYTLDACPTCVPAEAVTIAAPAIAAVGEAVPFTGTVSPADATPPITYTWDFGDGTIATGSSIAHTYAMAGTYSVVLTATNSCSTQKVTAAHTLSIGAPSYQQTISPTMRGGLCTSVYTLTNQGDATATVVHDFYDEMDQWLHSLNDSLAPGATAVYDLGEITELDDNYIGYTIISADQPFTYGLESCPPDPYFTLEVQPAAHDILPGDSAIYTVTLTAYEGFADPVDLSVTNVPTGASAAFGSDPLTPSADTLLTITVPADATAGDYTLSVQGADGGLTREQSVALEVRSQPSGAVPVITGVSPDHAYNHQATGMTISGQDFEETPQIYLGDNRLSEVTFVNAASLEATVPANLDPGIYDLTVVNPGGKSATFSNGFTVEQAPTPDAAYVLPTRGTNDVPVALNIYGAAFTTNVTVTLSGPATVPLADLARLSAGHVRGTVPISTTPGTYAVVVINPEAGSDTLMEAYQVVDASDESLNDFYASEQDVWVYTPTLRSGEIAALGLRVHRQGGKQAISTTVRFYENAPDGEFIGETDTPLLAANDSENTGAVSWVPDEAGHHTIYAIIDPEDLFPEAPADWAESNNVISRTFIVLPRSADNVPPRMDDFTINDGVDQTRETDVWLDANGSEMDLAGQSGVSSIRYEEFEYSQGSGDWILVHNSGWLDYETSHVNYPWTLVDSPGVRYLRAWVADAEGNISASPAVDFINYLPATEHVKAGGVNLYRRYVEAGEQLIVRVMPVSGDPDLYVWPPDWTEGGAWSSIKGGTAEDRVSFLASESGVYQIEVYGYTAANYQLEITTNSAQVAATIAPQLMADSNAASADKQKREIPVVDPADTPSNQIAVPEPPSTSGVINSVYLPLVIKH